MSRLLTWIVPIITLVAPTSVARPQQAVDDNVEALLERTMKAAVARVAPSVVQIETSGGTDVIGSGRAQIRKGTGPTTGVVISADGYVISSAFNFANKPAAIFVAIPGQHDRLVAKAVATDHTRMLTLLKVEAANLPAPAAAPKKDIRVGQWVLALGRTWADIQASPSVSIGIISALGRVWGKAFQTDAKVSPVNYGGPLIDLEGRVVGILVPASPRGQDETVGVDWYDSGIGFAIPLEDINRVLPQLKAGKDLHRGVLGILTQREDIYGAAAVITGTLPGSAATQAGIKTGDTIIEINGVPIARQAQMMHALGDKYEGDTIALKIKRGKEEINIPSVKLGAESRTYIHPFLGILPMRDDPQPGEEVRYIFPNGPADAAGLKAGDRIQKVGLTEGPLHPFVGRGQLSNLISRLSPGMEIKLEVARKEAKKTETIKLALGSLTDFVPDSLPEPATRGKALETPARALDQPLQPDQPAPPPKKERSKSRDKTEVKKQEVPPEPPKKGKKVDVGLLKRATATGENEYWLYVPDNYDSGISHALVVWLGPAGNQKEKDQQTELLIGAWREACAKNHIVMLCPKSAADTGWTASDTDFVEQIIRDCLSDYTIDRQRIVAHGMGMGGQMAFYLGFHARDLVRGVATTGAVLANQPKDGVAGQPLSFFLVVGKSDPLSAAIRDSKAQLTERNYPVVYREVPEVANQYLGAATLEVLVRWIDSLDRQ
jgi:S1-C subfamily serine protease